MTRGLSRGAVVQVLRDRARSGRLIVAVAGPPGAGKSTATDALAAELDGAVVFPMDGFHLDNAILDARGLRARKGAPETFDTAGFGQALARISAGETVIVPTFDRELDLARAGARVIDAKAPIVLVEGNYLLLDRAPWSDMRANFDLTISIDTPLDVLETRLIQRWLDHGLDFQAAKARAEGNDLPNARLVSQHTTRAELILAGCDTRDSEEAGTPPGSCIA